MKKSNSAKSFTPQFGFIVHLGCEENIISFVLLKWIVKLVQLMKFNQQKKSIIISPVHDSKVPYV